MEINAKYDWISIYIKKKVQDSKEILHKAERRFASFNFGIKILWVNEWFNYTTVCLTLLVYTICYHVINVLGQSAAGEAGCAILCIVALTAVSSSTDWLLVSNVSNDSNCLCSGYHGYPVQYKLQSGSHPLLSRHVLQAAVC